MLEHNLLHSFSASLSHYHFSPHVLKAHRVHGIDFLPHSSMSVGLGFFGDVRDFCDPQERCAAKKDVILASSAVDQNEAHRSLLSLNSRRV